MKKLSWPMFVKQNFNKNHDENYYVLFREIESGVAYSDLSHYTQEEVEEIYSEYLNLNEE